MQFYHTYLSLDKRISARISVHERRQRQRRKMENRDAANISPQETPPWQGDLPGKETPPAGRPPARRPPWRGDPPVNVRAVRILLECILVYIYALSASFRLFIFQ